jgi:RNA-directed DNA polymerase
MSAEQRGPSVCRLSVTWEGKDEMTKASVNLQDLTDSLAENDDGRRRRRIYVKAKAEKPWRFWGLYVHVCKIDTLREAYALAKQNDGAPGVDGVTFEAIETQGVGAFLEQIQDELNHHTYVPLPARKPEIPKDGARSASFRYRRSAIAWYKVRSSSYWSRSSTQTSNRDRLAIVPSGQLMRRSNWWPERLFSRRHESSTLTCAAISTMSGTIGCWRRQGGWMTSPRLTGCWSGRKRPHVTASTPGIEYARFADGLVILIDAHPRHDWLMATVEKRLREISQTASRD